MQRVRPLLIGGLTGLLVACAAPNTDPPDARNEGKGGAARTPNAGGAAGVEPALTEMPFDAPATGYVERNLYPGSPPNYLATAPAESVDPATGAIADVGVPTLRRYPVDASLATREPSRQRPEHAWTSAWTLATVNTPRTRAESPREASSVARTERRISTARSVLQRSQPLLPGASR